MKINYDQVQSIIVPQVSKNEVAEIIIAYAALKCKLDNPDSQSWYFKKGVKTNQDRLRSYKLKYERIKAFFNNSTIDSLLETINRNLAEKARLERTRMNFIKRMYHASISGRNHFLYELIRVKSITEVLMPIDHYLENPEEFLKFTDV